MRTLVELIERHADSDSEFRYYVPIIEKAEKNELQHPDITIECCVSLLQGISKTIVYRLDHSHDRIEYEKGKLKNQIRDALRCLAASDDLLEIGFPTAALNLAQVAGELRNERGDISHGRATPKVLESDRSLARLVLSVTEALLRYMLASYFSNRAEPNVQISYDEYPDFNDELDETFPLAGKPLYSRALYEQYYEDYFVQLSDFLDRLEVEEIE